MMDILPLTESASTWAVISAIILATFINEDVTCVAAGLLIAAGKVEVAPALVGCLVGIILGDFGIWLLGWLGGRRILRWRFVSRWLPESRIAEMSKLLCERSRSTVIASRLIPGTRVPLFLTAGILGTCPYRFLAWGFLAALVWTPVLVLTVAWAGASLSQLGWVVFPVVGLLGVLTVKIGPKLVTRMGRAQLRVGIAKIWRWEFWPAWLFYLPLMPWYLWLSLRYRSFTVWTATNPGIATGGVVGESKADILAQLPRDWIVPTVFIPQNTITERMALVRQALESWSFPLILKPNAAQRGAGVKKVVDFAEVETYLLANPNEVIAQPFHPGPFEAGIFYYRIPGEATGRIFSITDKVFPVVVGDGRSSLRELIWSHDRYRLQAKTFLERHRGIADTVLPVGEEFPLAVAGNHCQGTLFRDGGHLLTPALESRIDQIARTFDGFFIGRFDIRYRSAEELRNGMGFAIIELNGATSESTNLYDPSWSLLRAYRTLFRQWQLLFRIGHENRRRGHKFLGLWSLAALLQSYYSTQTVSPLAD